VLSVDVVRLVLDTSALALNALRCLTFPPNRYYNGERMDAVVHVHMHVLLEAMATEGKMPGSRSLQVATVQVGGERDGRSGPTRARLALRPPTTDDKRLSTSVSKR